MTHKAIRVEYYWPSMLRDATFLAQRCYKCQRFSNVSKKSVEELVPIARP